MRSKIAQRILNETPKEVEIFVRLYADITVRINQILKQKQNAWDFVEKYYPNYDHSQEICDANDLQKIVNGELNGVALEIFNDYIALYNEERGVKLPLLEENNLPDNWESLYAKEIATGRADYNEFHVEIYERAIEAFLERGERSVTWSVMDFECRAEGLEGNNWEKVYDKAKFKHALDRMIDQHDATIGITWDTIDVYLEDCRHD